MLKNINVNKQNNKHEDNWKFLPLIRHSPNLEKEYTKLINLLQKIRQFIIYCKQNLHELRIYIMCGL